jgi:hypothetical protein
VSVQNLELKSFYAALKKKVLFSEGLKWGGVKGALFFVVVSGLRMCRAGP